MPGLCWSPWLPCTAAHSRCCFLKLGSNCKRLTVYHSHASRSNAASSPLAGKKVVAIFVNAEQGRYRSEDFNKKKQGTKFCEESVSSALGSRLKLNSPVRKDGPSYWVSWIRRGLRSDLVNSEVEFNSSVVQEDAFPPGERKILEGESTSNSLRTGRHGGMFGRRGAILAAGYVVFSSVNCVCCSKAVAGDDWDYGDPSGVAEWQGLCAVGRKQSPIDISVSKAKNGESLGELQFDYGSSNPTIANPGHGTMQVSFPQGKNILRVGGRTLELLQFHFHAPSEHAFDGERFAMEAHLVHSMKHSQTFVKFVSASQISQILAGPNLRRLRLMLKQERKASACFNIMTNNQCVLAGDMESKKLAVVGVMLTESKFALPNKCLAESLEHAPAEHGQSVHVHDLTFSPSLLLPPVIKNGKREYVRYVGSLSTPPCSEGVDWFVLDKSLEIPTSQVVGFLRFAGDGHSLAFNSRPLQPLGGRVVYKGPE